MTLLTMASATLTMWGGAAGAQPPEVNGAVVAQSAYRLLGGDGGVFSFSIPFEGSASSNPALCPAQPSNPPSVSGSCRSMATTPNGGGYWILDSLTGQITTYGDAVSYGDPALTHASVPKDLLPSFIGIVATPDGKGYWVLELGLSNLGTVEPFGDAAFFGDETTIAHGVAHVGVPVAMASTRSGNGYWIVDSDGGVFAFGDAIFYGSMGGVPLVAPVVGIARTDDGRGYWLVAGDGGVFSFGDAAFGGSLGGKSLNAPTVGMAADATGTGYWLVGADGGVFALGGAPFLGSMGGTHLNDSVTAISSPPGTG